MAKDMVTMEIYEDAQREIIQLNKQISDLETRVTNREDEIAALIKKQQALLDRAFKAEQLVARFRKIVFELTSIWSEES